MQPMVVDLPALGGSPDLPAEAKPHVFDGLCRRTALQILHFDHSLPNDMLLCSEVSRLHLANQMVSPAFRIHVRVQSCVIEFDHYSRRTPIMMRLIA